MRFPSVYTYRGTGLAVYSFSFHHCFSFFSETFVCENRYVPAKEKKAADFSAAGHINNHVSRFRYYSSVSSPAISITQAANSTGSTTNRTATTPTIIPSIFSALLSSFPVIPSPWTKHIMREMRNTGPVLKNTCRYLSFSGLFFPCACSCGIMPQNFSNQEVLPCF